MLWFKHYNSLWWYPMTHPLLFIHTKDRISPSVFSPKKTLFPPGIPIWSSFNSVLGHITHSDTNVQQRRGGKLGANGWVIKPDKSHGALVCLIIQIPWEDTHGCFQFSTAAGRLIWCIMELRFSITAIKIRNGNVCGDIVAMLTC